MAKLTVSVTKPLVWPEMDRSDDGVEGDLRRRRFGRGRCGGLGRCERSGLGLLDEVDSGGAPGHDERTHGRRGARLRRRHSDGGVGHGGGARGGGAGEERGCLGGSGERERPVHGVSRAREAARRRAAAWHALRSPSGTCLPAWPASSSLERRWAGPAGGPGAGRQVSFSIFFCFMFF